jgi:O-antigen chain-terminating methyltransferase
VSRPEPREPPSAPDPPAAERGSSGALWRALRFPFTLRPRLRGVETRVDRLEADLPTRFDRLDTTLDHVRSQLDCLGEELAARHAAIERRLDSVEGAIGVLQGDFTQLRDTRVATVERCLGLVETTVRAVESEVEKLRDTRAPAVERRLDLVEGAIRALQGELEHLRDGRTAAAELRLDGAEAALAVVRDEVLPAVVDRGNVLVDRLAERLEELGSLVERVLRAEPLPAPLPAAVEERLAEQLSRVTSRVLTAFRGDEAEIRHRLDRYLPLLRASAPVLDLGCGRGELLLLLREAGVPALGVEGDAALVEAARRRGLEVAHGDVLETLRQQPDASRGAVTAIHLLEHLPPATLLAVLGEVRRVLEPGGLLVAEAPNPHCLRVGASLYWRDPTHQHPLLPETLELYLKATGFAVESVELLHPFPEEERLASGRPTDDRSDPAVAALAAEVLKLEQRLDELLNGPRDFAIVARRPLPGNGP